MSQENEQMDISDLGLWFGKTCPEPSVQTTAKTSESYWKRQSESLNRQPLFLDMRGGGLIAESFWDESGVWLGKYTTYSFGDAPRDVEESHLSQILEVNPLPKYSLSGRACQGILNRAKKRGKELPKLLEETLIAQSHFKNEQDVTGGVKASSSNTIGQEHSPQSTINPSCNQGESVVYGISPDSSNAMLSDNPHSGIYEADTTRTLDLNGGNPNCNQGGMIVLEGNGSRDSHKGDGFKVSDTMFTLNTVEQHGVCYSQDAYDEYSENDNSASLKAQGGSYGGGVNHLLYQKTVGALCASDRKGVGNQYVGEDKCIIEQRTDNPDR